MRIPTIIAKCPGAAVFFFLMLGSLGCDSTTVQPAEQEITGHNLPENRVSLVIDFGELPKKKITFRQAHVSGLTVLDLLKHAAKANDIEIEYTGSGETAFVTSIAGVVGGTDSQDWWIYRVNYQLGDRSAGSHELKQNDAVSWKLGKYK